MRMGTGTRRWRQFVSPCLLMAVLLGVGIGQLVRPGAQGFDYIKRLSYPAVVTIETKEGLGSGFFISSEGHLLTCYHLLADGHEVTVVTGNGKRFSAEVVGTDRQRDLAVIKVEAVHTPLLRLGEVNTARRGRIYLFGHQAGKPEWTAGSLITVELLVDEQRFIQVQGQAVPGYSGGPLIDQNGNVLGLITQLIGETDLALAIPASVLSGFLTKNRIVHSFVKNEHLPKADAGGWWSPQTGGWADLPLVKRGLIFLLPVGIILALIYFLSWYQRRKRSIQEHDFEIEFHAGSGL